MQRRLRSATRVLVPVLITLLAFGTAPIAAPAAGQSLDDRIAENRRKQRETSAEIEAAEWELARIGRERQEIELSVRQLGGELAAANGRLALAEGESERYELVAAALAVEIDVTQQELDESRAATKRSVVLLYQRSDSSAMLDLLGSATGAGSIVEGTHYLKRVSGKRRVELQKASVLRAQLAEQEAQLTESRRLADEARDQAAAEQRGIEVLHNQHQQALTNARSAETSYNAMRAELGERQAENTAEFQALSNEYAAALAQVGNTPAYGNGVFIPPVGRVPIASGFGYRTDPITGQQAFHAGVDFSASCGTPIKAADSGVIFSAGFNGGYGNATVVNHGAGLATLYAHQSSIGVAVGQVVEQGQVIGSVGSTGKSTGCHLHFEVRVNGNPVNPMAYL